MTDPAISTQSSRLPNVKDLILDEAERLWDMQRADGHIVFDLEADATIPAEWVMLRHFIGDPDPVREAGVARYLKRLQLDDGSWPLFHGGAGEISATVKAYWALKLGGEPVDSPVMVRARAWVLLRGGAARVNVFTRILMALFGQIPWRGAPAMPVEMMLLPRWAPFHLSKIAYWSRVVVVPLLILAALKPKAVNPTGLRIDELFTVAPADERRWQINPTGSAVGEVFLALDKAMHMAEPMVPGPLRRLALARADSFMRDRLNGIDGLGAIYPAMANSVMAMVAQGDGLDHPDVKMALDAIDALMITQGEDGADLTFQPCVSPIWDTSLAAHALMEAGANLTDDRLTRALDWMVERQITEHRGDWALKRPDLPPGGWAFQYENPDYPDVDDTAVVAMAMHRADPERYAEPLERAVVWIAGMQSKNGGWGAFDVDNTHYYLNSIPFADHGALLDPPTADVSGRCVGCLAQVDRVRFADEIARGVAYLRAEQEADGSWYGRWGANYIYGTWSVLTALVAAGVPADDPAVQRGCDWLIAHQRPDGGWGETLESYEGPGIGLDQTSTASQTAWALLGLMAAGRHQDHAVSRGVEWLQAAELATDRAGWAEEHFTGTGFPKIFYLKYHGYPAFFPLMALSRHQRMTEANHPGAGLEWGF